MNRMNNEANDSITSVNCLNIMMIWITCATVALLTVPFDVFSKELEARIDACRDYLYLALIFELSNFIAQALIKVWNTSRQRKLKKLSDAATLDSVQNMDFSERALLREFVLQRRSELRLPANEPTVRRLDESGILTSLDLPDDKGTVLYSISRQARPYITYRVLGLSAAGMTQEQIEQVMNERPAYAKPEIKIRKVYRSGDFKAA